MRATYDAPKLRVSVVQYRENPRAVRCASNGVLSADDIEAEFHRTGIAARHRLGNEDVMVDKQIADYNNMSCFHLTPSQHHDDARQSLSI